MSYDVQRRMADIYQQRADMGGCGPYGGMMDMDLYDGMYGDGVLIGGAKQGSKKAIANHRRAGLKNAKTNPWIIFLKKYAKSHGIEYGDAMSDPRARQAYRGKPVTKSKPPVSPQRLRALGLTRAQYNNLDLPVYKKGRIGRTYARRTKKLKSCVKATKGGPYTLTKNYKCVPRKKKT
jgi:hypothetical protein